MPASPSHSAAARWTPPAAQSSPSKSAGAKGSRQFTFASGTSISDIAKQINTFSEVTGVSAIASSLNGSSGVVLKTTEFGSDAFVSIDITNHAGQSGDVVNLSANDENKLDTGSSTALSAVTNAIRDEGQDVGAIINGIQANTDGKKASINTDFLNLEINLNTSAPRACKASMRSPSPAAAPSSTSAPTSISLNQVSIGIANVAARNLGSQANGYLNELGASKDANVVNGNVATAQKIVNDAISQVSKLRGRLGAFQKNTIGATIRSLNVALENTSAAESQIRDTDFAKETAELTRSQILVQAANNTLGIANSQPQNALSLLQ